MYVFISVKYLITLRLYLKKIMNIFCFFEIAQN